VKTFSPGRRSEVGLFGLEVVLIGISSSSFCVEGDQVAGFFDLDLATNFASAFCPGRTGFGPEADLAGSASGGRRSFGIGTDIGGSPGALPLSN